MKSVCVFCSSSDKVAPVFFSEIEKLGHSLAESNYRLVYGGATCGLMGKVADAALERQGAVLGIMPEIFNDKKVTHDKLTHVEKVPDLFERKRKMLEESDAFIVFPGGIGTLDEAIEMICYKQVAIHSKPIVFINLLGFWDRYLDMMFELRQQNMVSEPLNTYYEVVDTAEQAIEHLNGMDL